ncbi:MAG TPA: biotin/lipoyl-binding protein [Candidatus Dormibacteraeota bacterium]|jgi:multidrug efflux pump subunit AcrA (membrane-fusion protein)
MKLTVRRRLVVPAAVAVAVAGGGAALVAQHGASGSTQYRTAVATLGTVTQTISLSGSLAPVGETDLDFGSSGRVTAVDVHPGQAVTAGQALATIDPAALQAALTQAQATLSSAQARLSLDQAGPTAQSLAQAQAAVRTGQTQVQGAQTALADTQVIDQTSITSAQNALTAAQAKLAADRANSCPAAPTPTPAPSASPSPGSCASAQQISGDTAAATAARDGVSSAQAKAQQSEHQAQSQLSAAQVQLQNAQGSLTALQQGTTTQQVQIDQSQVQIDQINVDNAQKALTQATLTAPLAGAVAQVNVTVGQIAASGGSTSTGSSSAAGGGSSSTGSSTTHAIVILTPGAFQVVGAVSDAQVNQIAVGQLARVSVAGASQAISGRVTGIAPVATVTSGVATFPVTVVLDGTNPSLHSGVSASIAVVVNQAVHVITVPSSAIHPSGGTDSVQALVNGQPQAVPVTIGASDALRTQIVSGLNEGDTVVIATVSGTVPTPNASTLLGGGRGAGGGRGGTGRAGG